MKLLEIMARLRVPRRTIYSWMEKHPNVSQQDDKSLLGHPFPKPTHKDGRDNVWDNAAVNGWWTDNAKTVGRHPVVGTTIIMPWKRYREAMQVPPRIITSENGDEIIEDDIALIEDASVRFGDVRLRFRSADDAILFKLKYS